MNVLYADVGGTNVRFAAGPVGARPVRTSVALTSAYPAFEDALCDALARAPGRIEAVAVAAAGPVTEGVVQLTNAGWRLDPARMAAAAGVRDVLLLNDFEAAAHAVPALGGGDLRACGGGAGDPAAPRLILGPGTGLGCAGVAPDGRGGFLALPGEGGHADLAPAGDRELALIHLLQRGFGHVSVERIVSGPGLENLYMALAALDGVSVSARPAPVDIAARARDRSDPLAVETVARFTGWLGAAAGNAALILGARGGVYIAGGIVPAWGDLFDAALFRRRFEAKGRMKPWLAEIPSFVVTAPDVTFLGLAAALAARLRKTPP